MNPQDEDDGRIKGFLKPGAMTRRSKIIMFVVLAVVLLALIVFVNVAAALVVALFFAAFYLKVNPQVSYAAALAVLLLSALMTLIDQKSAAEFLANWAYCFLAIGVSLQFYYYMSELPDKEQGLQDEEKEGLPGD